MSTLKTTYRNCSSCGVPEETIKFRNRTSCCVPCYKEKAHQWNQQYYAKNRDKIVSHELNKYSENHEAINQRRKELYQATKDERNAKRRKLNAENKDAINAAMRAYRKTESGKESVRKARRKYCSTEHGKSVINFHIQKRRKGIKTVFAIAVKDLRRLANTPCVVCGNPDVTLDHIIPVSRGGSHGIGNLQSLCLSCNSSKGAKFLSEWKLTCRP